MPFKKQTEAQSGAVVQPRPFPHPAEWFIGVLENSFHEQTTLNQHINVRQVLHAQDWEQK